MSTTTTFIVDRFADQVAETLLCESAAAFVDYLPGDGTLYRLLFVLGPRPNEVTVAWPSYGRVATFPRVQIESDYVASKMFGGSTNERYENEKGPVTQLVNAVIARLR